MIQWKLTDRNDGATEYHTLVRATDGREFMSVELGKHSPVIVQVMTGDDGNADLCGLYNLDGEELDHFAIGSWEVVPDAEAPADIVAHVEQWIETPDTTIERVS